LHLGVATLGDPSATAADKMIERGASVRALDKRRGAAMVVFSVIEK
jgi:hypothetical protein